MLFCCRLIGVVAILCGPFLRADAPSLPVNQGDVVTPFPAVKLRAYGTLSGTQKVVAAGAPAASVLLINCQSVEKAQLLLAKYLSDLSSLPGVSGATATTPLGNLTVHQVEAQGVVAAVRVGSAVYVFTAADAGGVASLLTANLAPGVKFDSCDAEVPVPMYLDRWDKYAFRFYYGPFTRKHDNEAYDPRPDFTFADQSNKAGLILWNGPFHAPTAEDVLNTPSLEWVLKGALKLNLPLGINIGITDDNFALVNRYPDQAAPDTESYLGGWYYESALNSRQVSWASMEAQDAALGQLKGLVLDLNRKYPNIVNWLEPHEEMAHGVADMLDDRGGGAVAAFRDWMKVRFGTPEAVAARWGQAAGSYRSWDDVPYPELATFFGWGPDAIDLNGNWKISFTAPYDVDSAQPNVNDADWPNIGPNNSAVLRLLPRKPAVLRRHLTFDPAWLRAHPKVFFNLFDLENTRPAKGVSMALSDVLIFVNGKAFPEDETIRKGDHWSHLNITSAIKNGDNLITILLPQAFLDYRCFLSGVDYGTYPDLKPASMNAMWADFIDFISWSRANSVRRGMQMIRQVDPDRPITVMSPGLYWHDTKSACQDYGGILHDTGGMAGFWNDYNPVVAKATGLPTDCEPGGPAADLVGFKQFMGRWMTEDTQGVDYFIHIGDVEWHDDIRDYFTKNLPIYTVIGKDHTEQAQVGILDSARVPLLYGYPWNNTDHWTSNPDLILGSGMWTFPLQGLLLDRYPRAAITEEDFARGNADQFKVVVDTNTTIMDEPVVDAIEKWVQGGGIFVTYMQTGRHTSTTANAWPIAKLTGYNVAAVYDKPHRINLAQGQTFFHSDTPDWQPELQGQTGLSLQKVDPACQDLAQWEDGTVAAGVRKLGKGMVINLGVGVPNPLVLQILEDLKLAHTAGSGTSPDMVVRHFVSNNGLYDIFPIWNQSEHASTTDLVFHDGLVPAAVHDLQTGEGVPVETGDPAGAKLSGLQLGPWETRVLLSARGKLAQAPTEWFKLQRNWWQGTADPGKDIPLYVPRTTVPLDGDWAFMPLDDKSAPVAQLVAPATDDSKWTKMPLGVFDYPDFQDVKHAIFRKKFTVPADWKNGKVLMYGSEGGADVLRRYVDGKDVGHLSVFDDLGGTLTAGSSHVLAFEMQGEGCPLGQITPAWILYQPNPHASQALTEGWTFAPDFMTYSDPNPLPAVTPGAGSIRNEIVPDMKQQGRTVMLRVDCTNSSITGILFNGQFYPSYANFYGFIDVNVTPWVKWGQKNEIIVPLSGQVTVSSATLNYYDKGTYP